MYCEFVHARLSSMLLVFLTCLGGKVSVLVLGKKANAPQKTYGVLILGKLREDSVTEFKSIEATSLRKLIMKLGDILMVQVTV